MPDPRQLEASIWAMADGRSTAEDEARFEEDPRASLFVLDRLIGDTEDDLAEVRKLRGEEREQVVADIADTLESLEALAARLRPPSPEGSNRGDAEPDLLEEPVEPEPVVLQASWSPEGLVVWAGGRGAVPETNDELATRLETVGAPPLGWQLHAGVPLPGGHKADALTIPLRDALGWLVAVGAGRGTEGIGASMQWLGRVAIEGVRLVASGAMVPSLRVTAEGRAGEAHVQWVPAIIDRALVDTLTAAMPGPVLALGGGLTRRATTVAALTAVVGAMAAEAVERVDLPAQPPSARSATDLADSMVARLDGRPFRTDAERARDLARRIDHWARPVTDSSRQRLVVRLAPPDKGNAWHLSVHAPGAQGLVPIAEALQAQDAKRTIGTEWARLGRVFPLIQRSATTSRGEVVLGQDEAWSFMTVVGPTLARCGFDVRAPQVSRRTARPSLRLFAETPAGTTVGAHQLSNVAWSVLFDDVELTAAEVARLAKQARPLVQSHGRWIELDRVDLEKAAEALAERADITQMTGAEILRHSIGLDGSGLAGGTVIHGTSWAGDIVRRAGEAVAAAGSGDATKPEGFAGSLRSYQAEALAWIGFLDGAELGGCLALDMGLGKTPTVLAHLARSAGTGTTLVVAPAAVVGNWAAEAARFAPGLRVVVHHGATRAEADELRDEIAGADVVITTYATAVRDIDALVATDWARIVLDEAQAIKNAASETARQLRRIPARSRLALTGTPIENSVGDLWAVLDFTNPGLVGPRPAFVAQLSGDGESALRALNGVLLFRRTKAEPEVAAELPDKIDELDHCTMTVEQIGLYQAVLDSLVANVAGATGEVKQGAILAAITALKQICNHPAAYVDDGQPLTGRSGKLARLEEIIESVFAAGEKLLVFTHFATWGRRLADHLTELTGRPIECYDGSLARGVRDRMVEEFQASEGAGAMVLSLKAGGTGLNLTAANHVVLYDRWWNPAVEDQARDRAWRIGQNKTVISHRLVCPGTVDEKVEEVVAGKRHIANLVLPRSSSLADLDADQLRVAFGLRPDELLKEDEL